MKSKTTHLKQETVLVYAPNTPDAAALARLEAEKAAAKKALRDAQRKNDPERVAYSRELRDRWQEHVTPTPGIAPAPGIARGSAPGNRFAGMVENKARPRYDVGRLISLPTPSSETHTHNLDEGEACEVKRLAA